MGLELDFLTQVVNVSWGLGLAVEFTERPDYLTMNQALSMNKVVISFWFRVPKETAAKVRAATEDFFLEYRVFHGVIPLITWGSQQTTPVSVVEAYDTGAINTSALPIVLSRISGTHAAPLQPSCIGVNVGSEKPALLHVHIQTHAHASGTGLASIATSFTGDLLGTDIHSGKPIYSNIKYTTEDVSYVVTEEPEYLGNSDSNTSNSGAGHPDITLDQWHHLIISWELLPHTNMSTSGFCKMWCAIDDVNKNGFDLPAMCFPGLMEMGPNDHISWTPSNWQGNTNAFASVDFDSDAVPSNPFRAPGPPSAKRASDDQGGTITIAPIEKVELAELQIFSGVTLDTSEEANRRAFIDFERDENGNPIRDEHGKRNLKPVNPKQAEDLLRKKPAILLHGTTKWQNGKNTGSLGINNDGDEIPGGQFTPTGKIVKYPDPEITES